MVNDKHQYLLKTRWAITNLWSPLSATQQQQVQAKSVLSKSRRAKTILFSLAFTNQRREEQWLVKGYSRSRAETKVNHDVVQKLYISSESLLTPNFSMQITSPQKFKYQQLQTSTINILSRQRLSFSFIVPKNRKFCWRPIKPVAVFAIIFGGIWWPLA